MNSMEQPRIRPEELMDELGIKKSKYYNILKVLGIKAEKDEKGMSYLSYNQIEKIRGYLLGQNETAENDISGNSSMVKVDDNDIAASANSNEGEDIYIKPESASSQLDFSQLMRSAAELKTRELAMGDLVKREVANRMTEDDLPEDLREKLELAREAANPKFTPAEVADTLLNQWRNQGGI